MASTLLDALLEVVGDSGTVIALTFTAVQSASEKKPVAIFSPESPTTVGGFASAVLRRSGAKRSGHPSNSIAAIGANADLIVGGHGETALPFSWIQRLIELGGKQLLIGCVSDSPGLSTVHYTQEQLGLSSRSRLAGRDGSYVAVLDGEPRWVPRMHIPGCSMGFWKMYGAYVREGILTAGKIGEAYSIIATAADAAAVELPILRENPRAPLCDRSGCISCGSWSYAKRRLPALASHMVSLKVRAARNKLLRRPSGPPRSRA